MRRLFSSVTVLSLWASFSRAQGSAPPGPPDIQAFLPADAEAGYLFRLRDMPERTRAGARSLLFDVSETGQPWLLVNETFIPLSGGPSDLAPEPFRVPGLQSPTSFSIMRDGTLLVVSGRRLGAVTSEGFKALLDLPSAQMRIAPASRDECYLYGGETPSQRQSLYLYRRDGQIRRLLRAPEPVTAVTGFGDVTFVAIGSSIFLLGSGRPLVLAYEAGEEVAALAASPPSGLFYATRTGVGFVNQPGKAYQFLRGRTARPHVRNGHLFLFFPQEGDVLKCSPVSGFETLARSFEGGRR